MRCWAARSKRWTGRRVKGGVTRGLQEATGSGGWILAVLQAKHPVIYPARDHAFLKLKLSCKGPMVF